MSTTWWFDGAAVLQRVNAALEDALDEAAERVAADARQRAPIRKVFKEKRGFRFKTRALTAQEKTVATRLAKAYYAKAWQNAGPGKRGEVSEKGRRALAAIQTGRATLPSRASANTLAHSRADRQLGQVSRGRFTGANGATRSFSRRTGSFNYEPGAAIKPKLTGRGLAEVRSGTAVHTSAAGRVQMGGALKASIDTGPVREKGDGVEAEVAARIRYAKYVEFPTVHNRAQPFLLPALKDEQRTFVRDVASSIRRSLGG